MASPAPVKPAPNQPPQSGSWPIFKLPLTPNLPPIFNPILPPVSSLPFVNFPQAQTEAAAKSDSPVQITDCSSFLSGPGVCLEVDLFKLFGKKTTSTERAAHYLSKSSVAAKLASPPASGIWQKIGDFFEDVWDKAVSLFVGEDPTTFLAEQILMMSAVMAASTVTAGAAKGAKAAAKAPKSP